MPKKRQRWDALLDRIPTDRPILGAEVGVCEARLSKQLLAARPLLTLHLIDRWRAPAPGDSYASSGAAMAAWPQSRYDEAYQTAQDRMLPYVITKRAVIHRIDSVQAGESYDAGFFDFVFIDADHSYAGAFTDLWAWVPAVKPGGLICGHDYGRPDQGNVKEAVSAYFDDHCEIETGDAWTWFFRTPHDFFPTRLKEAKP